MSKPVTGALLGLIAGVFLAIFIQQTGAAPLDRLLLFGVAGAMALIGMLMCMIGRPSPNIVILIIAIIIVIVPIGLAASQLVSDEGSGPAFINNCTVDAQSDLEARRSITTMTRDNPFDIDPDGTMSWWGTFDNVITDYEWEIFVDVGGFNLRVANGMDPNEGESQENNGTEGLKQYSDQVRQFGGGEIRGVYYVSGILSGEGGFCDGGGYVRVPGSVFESTVGIIVGIIFIIIMIILVIICMRGRPGRVEEVSREVRQADDLGGLDDGMAK